MNRALIASLAVALTTLVAAGPANAAWVHHSGSLWIDDSSNLSDLQVQVFNPTSRTQRTRVSVSEPGEFENPGSYTFDVEPHEDELVNFKCALGSFCTASAAITDRKGVLQPSLRYVPAGSDAFEAHLASGDFALVRSGSHVDARAGTYDGIRKAVRRILRGVRKLL